MLDSVAARQEQRRLLDVDTAHEMQESSMPSDAQAVMAQASGGIGGLAMNIAHSDGDEDAMLTNLRNNSDTLSQAELQYIVNNSKFHKIKALAAEYVVR